MEAAPTRRTYKYKLAPTPAQAAQLGATVTYYQQKAELPEIRQIREDCAAIHSQVLQEVILRVHRTFQAFFRRVQHGETPGYPRFVRRSKLSEGGVSSA